MNYLAHALAFLTDEADHRRAASPLVGWQVAGTSLPDWLRVIDKRARLRPDVLDAVHVDDDHRFSALRDGAHRHHHDDLRFHADAVFEEVGHGLASRLRALEPTLRASTLGHVLTEMLLDAALMHRHPWLLDGYYSVLDTLDEGRVAAFARRATGRPLDHAEVLIDRFRRSRFLAAYQSDDGLLECLVGVCRRAGLQPPPSSSLTVIAEARHEMAPLVDRFFDRAGA